PERFRPWLAVLARRQAIRYSQRKNQRTVSLDEEVAGRLCGYKADQLLIDNIERREQYQQILQAVRTLPEKYRQVFMLQYTSDLTYGQIGEILDIPITTVQIRLVRARRMIYNQVSGKNKNKVREI
ncbi:MAG: RNA polymerase sigma factor, partial [Phycisphaerae bacterium]